MKETVPELRGDRVTLRCLVEDDLGVVLRWRSDPTVTRYWITRDVPTIDELRNWLAENRRTGSWTWLIADEHESSIGYMDVFNISQEHRHCELSIMIGAWSAWGKGYAREVLRVLLAHLFAACTDGGAGMHKVSLSVVAENQAARRAYLASGFREDGILRDDLWYDDRWHDQILMSILAGEFAEQDQSMRGLRSR